MTGRIRPTPTGRIKRMISVTTVVRGLLTDHPVAAETAGGRADVQPPGRKAPRRLKLRTEQVFGLPLPGSGCGACSEAIPLGYSATRLRWRGGMGVR
jgi:hypothetical protein